MVNHYLQWSWVQEWTTVCTKAIPKLSRIINDVSSLQFLWRLRVPWRSMDIDQLNLLPFSSIHLSVSNLQKAFVLAFLLHMQLFRPAARSNTTPLFHLQWFSLHAYKLNFKTFMSGRCCAAYPSWFSRGLQPFSMCLSS